MIRYETAEDMQEYLAKDTNIKEDLAPEVKVAVVTTQNVADGVSPVRIMAARPQTKNEDCEQYNEDVVKVLKDLPDCFLLSLAFDGLSAESSTVKLRFMLGEDGTIGVMDPNHAAKSFRSQLVLGTSIVHIGNAYFFYVGLLDEAGAKKSLYVVDDFASDQLVLQLTSVNTLKKLLACSPADASSMVFTLFLLVFRIL